MDGTITRLELRNPGFSLPWWISVVLVLLFLLVEPDREAVRKIREMREQGCEVVVISARPPWATNLTRWWLLSHDVPFNKVFCVGFGKGTKERKLEVIRREGVEYFFDDDRKIIDFLNDSFVPTTRL